MKSTFISLLALPTALRAVIAAPITSSEAVVEYKVQHRRLLDTTRSSSLSRRKRSSTLLSQLDLNDQWIFSGGYFLDIDVGTPPQRLQVLLDTGSSDLFIPSAEAARCLNNDCPGGSFSKDHSSTFEHIDKPTRFHTAYVDGSTANGSYVQDTVRLGKATLPGTTFALADELEVSPGFDGGPGPQYGIMGLSFDGQEASVCASAPESCDVNFTTPTILDSLYDAGHIKSRSYSVYLDDVASQSGSILFGGVDTAKFSGELVTLSTQKDTSPTSWTHGMYISQDLLMTSISSTLKGKQNTLTPDHYAGTVTLDSGAAALSLPAPIYDRIISELPVVAQREGTSAILCKDADLDAYLTFGLTGVHDTAPAHIRVPYSNLIVPVYEGAYDSSRPYLHDGEPLCVFALAKGADNGNVLGDPLLRSAYAVFNLDQKTISLAQASYSNQRSNVKAIGAGPMPSLVGEAPSGDFRTDVLLRLPKAV